MLRLVERIFGEGQLEDPAAGAPTRVAFELDVYRDWHVHGSDLAPGEWVIEGHLFAPADALTALAGRGDVFLLHLDDGRRLQVFALDGAGRIVNVEGTTFSDPPSR